VNSAQKFCRMIRVGSNGSDVRNVRVVCFKSVVYAPCAAEI
jgi:hypothetical protein